MGVREIKADPALVERWEAAARFTTVNEERSRERRWVIASMRAAGVPVKDIAAKFRVTTTRIRQLLHRAKRDEANAPAD